MKKPGDLFFETRLLTFRSSVVSSRFKGLSALCLNVFVWLVLACFGLWSNAWFPELTSTGDTFLKLRDQLRSQILFCTRMVKHCDPFFSFFPGVPGECPGNELLACKICTQLPCTRCKSVFLVLKNGCFSMAVFLVGPVSGSWTPLAPRTSFDPYHLQSGTPTAATGTAYISTLEKGDRGLVGVHSAVGGAHLPSLPSRNRIGRPGIYLNPGKTWNSPSEWKLNDRTWKKWKGESWEMLKNLVLFLKMP